MCESVDLCGWSGGRDASLFLKGDGVNHLKMEIKTANWRGCRGSEDIKSLTHTYIHLFREVRLCYWEEKRLKSDLGKLQGLSLCSKNSRLGEWTLLAAGRKFPAAQWSISSCPNLQMQVGSLLSIPVAFQKVTGHISLCTFCLCPWEQPTSDSVIIII